MNNKVLLVTNVKDEVNILEWIQFHLLVGFDHILIWDDGSARSVRGVVHRTPSIPQRRVTVKNRNEVKLNYMRLALDFAREEQFTHMLYLDGDEYLCLGWDEDQQPFRIHNWIQSWPQDTIAVYLQWMMFGSNYLEKEESTSCIYPYRRCRRLLDYHIKAIVHVPSTVEPRNPHVYKMKDQTKQNTLDGCLQPVFHFGAHQPVRTWVENFKGAFIAHYRYQDWTRFRARRSRVRDDTKSLWQFPFPLDVDPAPPQFHRLSNDIEYLRVVEYFEDLKKK